MPQGTHMWITVPESWVSGPGEKGRAPEGTRKGGWPRGRGAKVATPVCLGLPPVLSWEGVTLLSGGLVLGRYAHTGHRIRRGRKSEGGCLGNQFLVQGIPQKISFVLKSLHFRLWWKVLLGHCCTHSFPSPFIHCVRHEKNVGVPSTYWPGRATFLWGIGRGLHLILRG